MMEPRRRRKKRNRLRAYCLQLMATPFRWQATPLPKSPSLPNGHEVTCRLNVLATLRFVREESKHFLSARMVPLANVFDTPACFLGHSLHLADGVIKSASSVGRHARDRKIRA